MQRGVRALEQIESVEVVVLKVEVKLWLLDASQFGKVRLIAPIVTFKSFVAFFLVVTASRVDERVDEYEQYCERAQESDHPHWEGNPLLDWAIHVFVPQLEQVLIVTEEGFEFGHLSASLLGDEFMNPHCQFKL